MSAELQPRTVVASSPRRALRRRRDVQRSPQCPQIGAAQVRACVSTHATAPGGPSSTLATEPDTSSAPSPASPPSPSRPPSSGEQARRKLLPLPSQCWLAPYRHFRWQPRTSPRPAPWPPRARVSWLR
eukprot:6212169-Pleurochrysis_carterae.AAC.5